jgi:hypothetical protein
VHEELNLAFSNPILTSIQSTTDLIAYLKEGILTREMANPYNHPDQVRKMFEDGRKLPGNVSFVGQAWRKEDEVARK